MRLIDTDALLNAPFQIPVSILSKDRRIFLQGIEFVGKMIQDAPSVPAVPIDKLCEWLEVNARTPIYNLQQPAEWWKASLTMWMEEELHE